MGQSHSDLSSKNPHKHWEFLEAGNGTGVPLSFGYTTETMKFMLVPMITTKKDPIGSMGNDACLACLSDKPRMLYDYFKQLFAQVTNPAIDSIREEVIMSLECYIGPEQNLLETTEEHARRLRVPHPILSNEQMAALKRINRKGWHTRKIDITWPKPRARQDAGALDRICSEAEKAVDDGDTLVILSDRPGERDRCRLARLLATGAVHHHLVRQEERTRIGIVVETGEAREVHHHCLLVGYGRRRDQPVPGVRIAVAGSPRGAARLGEGSRMKSGEGDEHPAIESVSDGEAFDPVTRPTT